VSQIKALGVHSYFGGFAVGVARNKNIRVLGSMENWKPAVTWAPKIGVNVLINGEAPRADYVFGNPPCSRFSPMSYSKYTDESRENLDQFEDMEDVLTTAKYSGAELVHLENGPLMYNNGRDLMSQFNEILEWPEIYVLVLKVGSMHAGLPQLRPRTHAFVAKRPFPDIDLTPLAMQDNIGLYMRQWDSEYEYEAVPSCNIPDPVAYAGMQAKQATFISTRPKIISINDTYAYSMVSSRHFVWLEENAWWPVDHYAAIQGYNPDGFDYSSPGIPLAMALISKSVSPTITEYLAERIVVPYFDTGERSKHRPIFLDLT